ncbi:hypothetical protein, partial [Streptomyces sp. NPDC059900]
RARQITREIHDREQRALARCDMVTALAGAGPVLQAELLAKALRTARKLPPEEHEAVLEQVAAHLLHTPLSRRKVQALAEQVTEQTQHLPPSKSRSSWLCRLANLLIEVDCDSATELALEALHEARSDKDSNDFNVYARDALMVLALTDARHFEEIVQLPLPDASHTGGIDYTLHEVIRSMLEQARDLAADAASDDPAGTLPPFSFQDYY